MATLQPEDFEAVAAELGLEGFDILLAGDGSGTTNLTPCGWLVGCYFRPTGKVTVHYGCCSAGSNNYAELYPYVHALRVFHSAWVERHPQRRPEFNVVVVSDSEVTVRCGNGEYAARANLDLWASLDWFRSQGYRLAWRHVRRNTTNVGRLADRAAGRLRKMVADARGTLWD